MTKLAHRGMRSPGVVSAPIWSGLTAKQDRFAQLVVEGSSYSAAYRAVYDAGSMSLPSVWREAHRLSRNEKVASRIAELVSLRQREACMQASSRAYRVVAELENIMTSAKSDTARLRAAELLGKTVGLFREVRETRGGGAESVAELEAQLDRLLRGV